MINILVVGNGTLSSFDEYIQDAQVTKTCNYDQAWDYINSGQYEFVLGDYPLDDPQWTSLGRNLSQKNSSLKFFHESEKESFNALFCADKENKNFVKVENKQMALISKYPCDIYLMISSEKYIKLIPSGDSSGVDIFMKYKMKGAEAFYVKREDYFAFSKEIQKALLESMQNISPGELTLTDVAHLQAQNVLVLKELCQNLKIDPKVMGKLNDVVVSNVKFIMRSKGQMRTFFKNFLHGGPFLYGHSVMVSHLANHLSLKFNWATSQTMEKLSMAALLHDLGLSDEKFSKVDDGNDESLKKFTEKEIEEYRRHPILAYNFVSQQNDILPDVGQIILSHHEKPDGTGFPRGLNATQLSQISCLFNLTHYIVSSVYGKVWAPEIIENVIVGIRTHYTKGNYSPIADAFIKMLNDLQYN